MAMSGLSLTAQAFRISEGFQSVGRREPRERVAPDGQTLKVVYFKQYDKELLWGVTARITLNFLQALQLA